MKLQGFVGKGSGKLGASVWTVRKGVQIVREYNDKVSNPNTQPQVEQRAKFKLLTQLSAIVADAMAFSNVAPGQSMRNMFMKRNMSAVEVPFNESKAILKASEVQLSDSSVMGGTIEYAVGEGAIIGTFRPADGWRGMRVAVITLPAPGRVYGTTIRSAEVQPSSGAVEVRFIPHFPEAEHTVVLGVFWRFRDAAAEAKYNDAAGESNNISVVFDRMVKQGDIEFSQTIVATRTE